MVNFKPQRMVGWYEVKQLGATAIRAILSSVFGSYSDKRETMAGFANSKVYDYTDISDNQSSSDVEDFWFDYISDTGDGFNPTFSMCHLISQPEISLDTGGAVQKLERGRFVIFGGDQVYPTPSKSEYFNRFIGPLTSATSQAAPNLKTDLFAIPGNHDWYDGLTNFVKIFCNKKKLGGFQTKQDRSYFAIKVREDLWVWALDVQLQSEIDDLQIDYFKWVAKKHMKPGNKVIVCTAEPAWVYKCLRKEDHSYDSLESFERQVIEKNGLNQILTIAGDLHHYARYSQTDPDGVEKHKITAGGGGAFLHPTHNLPDKLSELHDGEFNLKKSFPEKSKSRKISFLNIFFPHINAGFGFFLATIHLLMAYDLYHTSRQDNLPGNIFNDFQRSPNFLNPELFGRLLSTFIHSPIALLILVIFIFGFKSFCDGKSSVYKLANLAGVTHGFMHVVLMLSCFSLFAWFNHSVFGIPDGIWFAVALALEVFFIGGFLSGVLVGVYLMFSSLVLKMHDNEAFSSLKIEGFKNFLRFHIKDDKLTIYPIGLVNAPVWYRKEDTFLSRRPLKPSLIEQPIVIDLGEGRVNNE